MKTRIYAAPEVKGLIDFPASQTADYTLVHNIIFWTIPRTDDQPKHL